MELRHLRYFLAVAENLHFSLAAKQLNISQPPLSQQIFKLEEELNVKLFDRTKRSVKLTQAGLAFQRRAKAILASVSNAVEEAKNIEKSESETLTIGIMSSLTLNLILPVLKRYQIVRPSTNLSFKQLDTSFQYRGIDDGHIDIGIVDTRTVETTTIISDKNIQTHHILKQMLHLAVPKNHPLASQKSLISIADLASEKFISLTRNSHPSFHDAMMDLCITNGFSPEINYETDQIPTALTMVAAGYGITFSPALSIAVWENELAFIELPDDPFINVSLITRKESLSSSANTFIDLVGQCL